MIHGVEDKSAARWRDTWLKQEQRFEDRMALQLRNVSRELQREVLDVVKSRSTLGQQEMLREIEHILVTDGTKNAQAAAREITKAGMERWSGVVATEVGIGDVFNLRNDVAEAFIKKRGAFLRDHYGTRGRKLTKILGDHLRAGEPQDKLTKQVMQFMRVERAQAQTIARTEIGGAMNFSANEAMVSAYTNGVDVRSKWLTMNDPHVRDGSDSGFDHVSADGLEIIPGKNLFIVSGEGMEYPGDSSNGASPGNTINCRCTTQPLVKGLQ